MSEVNVSMRNQIYFAALLSLNANLQIMLYPQQIYRQTKLIGRKITIYDCKQKHGLGVVQACHAMISDLPKM